MQEVLKNNITLTQALRLCLSKKVHFAAYRLPGDNNVTAIVQKDMDSPVITDLSSHLPRKGFLIAPFSKDRNQPFLIRPDLIIRNVVSGQQLNELLHLPDKTRNDKPETSPEDTGREEYLKLVEDSVGKIASGEFEKVVLSRVKTVKGPYYKHLEEIFSILCDTYTNAFVYLFCVNGKCWTGATPEPFVCSGNNELKTVSLAGTRALQTDNIDIHNWNKKEILEQEYVTLHIEKTLLSQHIKNFTKYGPYVAQAGNLLHLRTDFTFSKSEAGSRLALLINALHPTPAVCGMSTGKAMDFINRVEKHNREYYTGFLGPLGIDDDLQLFVNLRCLKVYPDCVTLFMGGGITCDSVPEEEWRETDIKAETLLSVLRQF